MKLLAKLFGRQIKSADYDLRFHKEANLFGEHGLLVVSHRRKGLVEEPVRFVFAGLTTPPKLTLRLMTYLWEEAQNQGYIVHHLLQYGKENDIVDTLRELAPPPSNVARLPDVHAR